MSYERYDSQRRRHGFASTSPRTTLGYWVPLVLTVTVATVGLAAWVWKERSDDEDEETYRKRKNGRPAPGNNDPTSNPDRNAARDNDQAQEDAGILAKMSGALRRTPSPQQIFDEAGRRVAAGVAAAGAAVGGALTSIKEEGAKGDFEDHTRWSEEAMARSSGADRSRMAASGSSTLRSTFNDGSEDRRKKVVLVVSADTKHQVHGLEETSYLQEHASILSHLPEHIDDDCRIFVMIYAPDLQQHPLSKILSVRPAASIASSYSSIGHEDLHTPAEESEQPFASGSRMFDALYAQARTLVDKDTMIMPFTTPTGYVNLLRHVNPKIVYIQATLSGDHGETVKQIAAWTGQVVLVVGDETGHGGLVDSEDERGTFGDEYGTWWKEDTSVGLGKGIEVVDGLRVGEDWRRRVRGHD